MGGGTGASTAAGARANLGVFSECIDAYAAMGSAIKATPIGYLPSHITANVNVVDQQLIVVASYLSFAATITGVIWFQVAQGSYTANNNNKIGLYSYSAGTLNLVASCANDGNLWKGTSSSWQKKAFSSTYPAAAGLYFIAYLYCRSSAVAVPTIGSLPATLSGIRPVDFTNSGILTAYLNAQTDLPNSQALSGMTGYATTMAWVGLY